LRLSPNIKLGIFQGKGIFTASDLSQNITKCTQKHNILNSSSEFQPENLASRQKDSGNSAQNRLLYSGFKKSVSGNGKCGQI
jgi:hypothetical protein